MILSNLFCNLDQILFGTKCTNSMYLTINMALLHRYWVLRNTNITISPSCIRLSHGETISKQKDHKLNVSIIKLFNSSIKSHGETVSYKKLYITT